MLQLGAIAAAFTDVEWTEMVGIGDISRNTQ
jgi:hypothetical protein